MLKFEYGIDENLGSPLVTMAILMGKHISHIYFHGGLSRTSMVDCQRVSHHACAHAL